MIWGLSICKLHNIFLVQNINNVIAKIKTILFRSNLSILESFAAFPELNIELNRNS